MEAVRSRLLSIFFRSRRVMNVDPVKTNSPGIERQTPEKKVHIAPPSLSVASGNAPKAEIARKENSPTPLLIPEHEVKVQLDTAEDDIIVYQVLDKQSGGLVLQVPMPSSSAASTRRRNCCNKLLREERLHLRTPFRP